MEPNKSFLGTGWAFPVSFDHQQGTVDMASDVPDIEQSLTILLNTRPGERVMRPDFGCALDDLLFEPVDAGIITFVKDLISKAILYYEPRVNLQNIEIVTDPAMIQEGRILIELDIVVRTTNGRFNYVYDYYKREASIQPLS
ncbi:MAG: GPW/gp25 family protein [Lewinellaceae bacterium]|nr:GPW/gp25 family protein [Lewinellaceae bacterium]